MAKRTPKNVVKTYARAMKTLLKDLRRFQADLDDPEERSHEKKMKTLNRVKEGLKDKSLFEAYLAEHGCGHIEPCDCDKPDPDTN